MTEKIAATICIWGIVAGLVGLIWLSTQHPFTGLPITHPINLGLLGFCLLIGVGFSLVIWLSRPKK
jgi:hypothetical protein